MTISAFFESLDAPLVNRRWSWGAVSRDGSSVYLRVWKHEILIEEGARYVTLDPFFHHGHKPARLGYRERLGHVRLIKDGRKTYCILCYARDPQAPRKRIAGFCETPIPGTLAPWNDNCWLKLAW